MEVNLGKGYAFTFKIQLKALTVLGSNTMKIGQLNHPMIFTVIFQKLLQVNKWSKTSMIILLEV